MTSNTMVVCSVPLFAMTISKWRRSTLRELGWNTLTLPQTCCWRVPSWIFLSQMIFHWMVHLLILILLTVALPCLSLSRRWPPLSQSHQSLCLLPILKIPFYLHSFVSTLRSPMSTMGNIIKVTSASRMVSIGLFSNLMSKNIKKIGVSPSPTFPRLEVTCA